MTFLKKLGQVLASVVGIAAGVGPIVLPFLGSGKATQIAGVAVNDLTAIGQLVAQMEVVGNKVTGMTGAQKLAGAIGLIGPVIKTSELVSGKKIANEALFTQAVTEYAQATVDLLNSLDQSAVA